MEVDTIKQTEMRDNKEKNICEEQENFSIQSFLHKFQQKT